MTTQPEALRLAEVSPYLEGGERGQWIIDAAAELRRLSAENEALWKEREEPHKTIEMYVRECNRLESERDEARRTVREAHEAGTQVVAQRNELLEALKEVVAFTGAHGGPYAKARAAIKAVEGEKT